MKKIVVLTCFLLLIGYSFANATPWTDNTKIWNTWTGNVDGTDAYGSPSISGGTYTASNGFLSQITYDYNNLINLAGPNVVAVDLFIDKEANGYWDYVVPLSIGLTSIIQLSTPIAETDKSGVYKLSYVAPVDGKTYDWRRNHPIGLINYNGIGTSIGTFNWNGFNQNVGTHSTTMNFTNLSVDYNFMFSWTVSCANDVVKGSGTSVPEPTTLLLLGTGLLGLSFAVRRRKR